MSEIIRLQKKIVPEIIELCEKRYNILRNIFYNAPIGRRALANSLGLGERIVRTEVNFLKNQNLIDIRNDGMVVTKEGEEIIHKLSEFTHEIKELTEIEELITKKLNLKKVVIVSGDISDNKIVKKELGRVGAETVRKIIKDRCIISLTGGTTVKELIDNVPTMSGYKDILVVPARGGMGKNVETQANSIAAKLANKVNGKYKLLHVPDNLSDIALEAILKEKDVKDVIENIEKSNVLIFGIGRAEQMARRRGMSQENIDKLLELGAVGEAFGHYFDIDGNIIYSSPTVGIKKNHISNMPELVAVAGGHDKAGAIYSVLKNNTNAVLVTDEGAANGILDIIKNKEKIK